MLASFPVKFAVIVSLRAFAIAAANVSFLFKTAVHGRDMIRVLNLLPIRRPAMRKLVVTEFVSLDGVIENPMWTFPYWNEEIAAFKGEESAAGDALLLGSVTYDGFAVA